MKFAAVASLFLASAIAAPLEERSESYPDSYTGYGKGAYSKDVDYRLPGSFSYPKGSDHGHHSHDHDHYAGYRRNEDYDHHDHHHHHYDGDLHDHRDFGHKDYHHGGYRGRYLDNGYPRGGDPYWNNGGNWNGPRGGNWNNGPGGNGGNWNNGGNGGNWNNGGNGGNWNNGPGGNNGGNGGNNGGNGGNNGGNGGNNGGNGGNNGGNGGGKSCPSGLLYTVPQCCTTDVLGVVDLDCKSPPSGSAKSFTCPGKARCCSIPVAGIAALCVEV